MKNPFVSSLVALACSLPSLAHAQDVVSLTRDRDMLAVTWEADDASLIVLTPESFVLMGPDGAPSRIHPRPAWTRGVDVQIGDDFIALSKKKRTLIASSIGGDTRFIETSCANPVIGVLDEANELAIACGEGRTLTVTSLRRRDRRTPRRIQYETPRGITECSLGSFFGEAEYTVLCTLDDGSTFCTASPEGTCDPTICSSYTNYYYERKHQAQSYSYGMHRYDVIGMNLSLEKDRVASVTLGDTKERLGTEDLQTDAAVSIDYDIDRDGVNELVVASTKRIAIFDPNAKTSSSYSTSSKDYGAALEHDIGAASSIPSSSEASNEALAGASKQLRQCVEAHAKSLDLGSSESYSFSVRVDDASGQSDFRASLASSPAALTRCVERAVGAVTLPRAPEGSTHTVRMTLRLTNRLRPSP